MLIDIEKIKVSDRIRKDFGDIKELAEDIQANGLINPPVVTPEYELIAGERRLRACKVAGFSEIEVKVMTVRDFEHQLQIEISENEHRKEFTYSERMEYARRLEQVERLKSQERIAAKEILPGHEGGQVRDIVAEKAGFGSGRTYDKAKFILENATPEIIQQLDAGDISTHKAFIETKERLETIVQEAEERAEQAEREKIELQRQYKNSIPADQFDDAVSEAIERHQEETSLLLTQKEKEKQHLLKQKEEEWKVKHKQEMENSEFVLKNLRDGLKEAQEKIKSLELQQPGDFDEQHKAELLKKLSIEARINTLQLAIQIENFLQKIGITAFMIGAIAESSSSDKRRLSKDLDMLESFVSQLKPALSGRKVVNEYGND
ncbi:Chromosome-partitioning protein Spo0J [compost metagenome]